MPVPDEQRLKAVEEFVKTLTARIEKADAWITTLAEGLESLEKRFDQIVTKLGEVNDAVDLNGSDHEERLDRLERAPVESTIRRRELALQLANANHLTLSGTGSLHSSHEQTIARAKAYLAFLEGRDP